MPLRFLCVACLLATTAVLVSGCRWLEHRSPLPVQHSATRGQLVLYRETTRAEDTRLLDQLEGLRGEMTTALGLPESQLPIHVYLFDEREPYEQFLRQHFPSFPLRRAVFVDTGRQLAVYAYRGELVAVDLRHEVAHGYLHATMAGVPLWLDEGIAEYFEVGQAQRGLNGPHVELIRELADQGSWQPSLTRLESLQTVAEMTQEDYAESWAWVYWLLTGPSERSGMLASYLAELRENGQATPLSLRLRQVHYEPARTMSEQLSWLEGGASLVR